MLFSFSGPDMIVVKFLNSRAAITSGINNTMIQKGIHLEILARVHFRKLTWQWKISILNRKYVSSNGGVSNCHICYLLCARKTLVWNNSGHVSLLHPLWREPQRRGRALGASRSGGSAEAEPETWTGNTRGPEFFRGKW